MSKQLQKSGIPYLTHLGGGAGCSQRIGRADGRQYPSPWEGAYLTHHAGGAGCDEALPCAEFCWAKKLAGGRLAHLPQYKGLVKNGRWTGKVWEDPDFAAKLAARKVPSVVGFWFMGDCALASEEFLRSSFEAFAANPQHQVLVLTKRIRMLLEKLGAGYVAAGSGLPNIWLGVSASTQEEYDSRVSALCDPETGWPGQTWLSAEPLLGPLDLGQWASQLGWIVAGSANTLAHDAAAFTPDIARSLRDQCREAGVPYYLKQAAWDLAYWDNEEHTRTRIFRPSRRPTEAPSLDFAQHLAAPEPIAAILRMEGKL